MTAWWRICLGLASVLALTACETDIHKDIHGNIHIVVNRDDSFVTTATSALERYGVRALPQIETAFHSAKAEGRLRLVDVLGRIKHTETIPLLRHLALFDADPNVRRVAEWRLTTWADDGKPGDGLVSRSANLALRTLRESRARGLGPLVRDEG